MIAPDVSRYMMTRAGQDQVVQHAPTYIYAYVVPRPLIVFRLLGLNTITMRSFAALHTDSTGDHRVRASIKH
jgi:hypothetical protein